MKHRFASVAALVAMVGALLPTNAFGAEPEAVAFAAVLTRPASNVLVSEGTGGGLGNQIAMTRRGDLDVRGRGHVPLILTRGERAAAQRNGGWLNFQAIAIDDAGQPVGFTAFSRYIGSDPEMMARQAQSSGPVEFAPTGAVSASYTNCNNYRWVVKYRDWNFMTIGELHTASDSTAKFTYGRTADSDVGVAFSDNGGAWYLSGSAHAGNSLDASVGQNAGAHFGYRLISQFNYAQLWLVADCFEGWGLYMGHRSVEVDTWRGSITSSYDWRSLDNNRNSWWNIFGAGTVFDRSTTAFLKYSGAVSIWGASLTAKSGASAYVKVHWSFGTGRTKHYLYGNDNYPLYSHRIYASDS
jgi:hypothetical protein